MRLRLGVAGLAALLGCGEGLRDGTGRIEVTRAVEGNGPIEVTLAQGRFYANHITKAATVTLRRLPPGTLPHEIGPVFEIDIDGMGAFDRGLPYFEVTLAPDGELPVRPEDLRAATYKGGASDTGWHPLTSNYRYDPDTRTVRGDINVPSLSGGVKLQLGTVIWCGSNAVNPRCPWEPGYCGNEGACQ